MRIVFLSLVILTFLSNKLGEIHLILNVPLLKLNHLS